MFTLLLYNQPKIENDVAVPRDLSDYTVTVNEADIPKGILLQTKVG